MSTELSAMSFVICYLSPVFCYQRICKFYVDKIKEFLILLVARYIILPGDLYSVRLAFNGTYSFF
jgi:hypothetical protein